jgi:hypothetical protein
MREEAEGSPPLLPISGSCSCSSDFTCTIKGRMLMTTSSSMQIKTGANIVVRTPGSNSHYNTVKKISTILQWCGSGSSQIGFILPGMGLIVIFIL